MTGGAVVATELEVEVVPNTEFKKDVSVLGIAVQRFPLIERLLLILASIHDVQHSA